MHQAGRVLRLVLTNGALLVACLVFASGFFPYKPFLPGLATFQNEKYGGYVPVAPFDKVIFMVVDALRSDFVFSSESGFKFTQRLISNGSALPFTTYAAAPTVTMPRVKAITTGSIPSFLDMILNFAESDKSSSLATQDTWLAQMKAKENGKLIMYGDDTWLKLFPDFFARADGTSSFFVSDYTEVDNNVTRHVPEELKNSDWNVMIMHYLGMDHIGHKGGPRSVNMLPKQQEMDGIVQKIYGALENESHLQSTLFVMCGDHGMNDAGNHGGSAPGETSPALVFMSPKLSEITSGVPCPTNPSGEFDYYNKVEQSDIAPTLAGLLGFPSPLNNLGVFIPQFLNMWRDGNDHVQLMLNNALQILGIIRATSDHPVYENPRINIECSRPLTDSEALACQWKAISLLLENSQRTTSETNTLMATLTKFCHKAQSMLSSTASSYDSNRLYSGIGLALATMIVCFATCASTLRLPFSFSGTAFVAVSILYGIMMFASSYVEEEQQFWYWATAAWASVQFIRRYPGIYRLPWSSPAICLVLLRILRRWNQSGQKWQGADDITKLIQQMPGVLLWPLIMGTFHVLASEISLASFEPPGLGQLTSFGGSLILTMSTLLLKISQAFSHERWLLDGVGWAIGSVGKISSVLLARLEFLLLLLSGFYVMTAKAIGTRLTFDTGNVRDLASGILPLFTLFIVGQARPLNVPVFLLCHYLMKNLRGMYISQKDITLGMLLLSHCTFFAMGNTNAISSIDLSNAYNGITSYNPLPVGILLFVGNWAGPCYWSFSGIVLVLERSKRMARARESTLQALARNVNQSQKTEGSEIPKLQAGLSNGEIASQPAHLHAATIQRSTISTSQSPNSLAIDQSQSHNDRMSLRTMERRMTIEAWLTHAELLTFWSAVEILAVLAACTILRTHLFVWTVFSPKFLYVAAWFVGWHVCCNLLLGGLLAWIQ